MMITGLDYLVVSPPIKGFASAILRVNSKGGGSLLVSSDAKPRPTIDNLTALLKLHSKQI
jgi:hypothetical protein